MAEFVPERPIRSKEPRITVDNQLKPGRYRFSLVAVDDALNESAPAEIIVSVVEKVLPRPVIRPDVIVRPIPIPPIRPLNPLKPR